MPHLIIHSSHDAASPALVQQLHKSALENPAFPKNDVKTRLLPAAVWHCGEQNQPFVHLEFRCLEGRTTEVLQNFAQDLYHLVLAALPKANISVEVIQMPKALYVKQGLNDAHYQRRFND